MLEAFLTPVCLNTISLVSPFLTIPCVNICSIRTDRQELYTIVETVLTFVGFCPSTANVFQPESMCRAALNQWVESRMSLLD